MRKKLKRSTGSAAINPYSRTQSFRFTDYLPYRTDGLCRCGCGQIVNAPQRVWATKRCASVAARKYAIVKGDVQVIRTELWKRDHGRCAMCGRVTRDWEADHILEVCNGGGGCGLENYQTLCVPCHQEKTQAMMAGRPRRKAVANKKKTQKKPKGKRDMIQPEVAPKKAKKKGKK